MNWSDTPAWRKVLDPSRLAVETLTRDMQIAERRGTVEPETEEAAVPAVRRKRRKKQQR